MADIPPLVKEFNELWSTMHVDEVAFPNRKAATMRQWLARSLAARKAMKDQVDKTGPPPKKKNPFFWVQDFPEPRPTNLNGKAAIDRLMKTKPLVSAPFHGEFGIFTLEEADLHGMTIKRGVNFDYELYKQTGIINLTTHTQ